MNRIYFFLGCGNEFLFPHLFIDFAKVPKKFNAYDDVFYHSSVKVSFNLGTLRHTLFKRDSGIRSSHFISRLFTMNGHSCSINLALPSLNAKQHRSSEFKLLVYSHYNRQSSQRSGKYSLSSQTSYNRLPPRFAFYLRSKSTHR